MNEMSMQPKCDTKKSLMISVNKLESTASRMEEVVSLSELMIDKLKRMEGALKSGKPMGTEMLSPTTPDIIDLFDGVNSRIEERINTIRINIERVLIMIE